MKFCAKPAAMEHLPELSQLCPVDRSRICLLCFYSSTVSISDISATAKVAGAARLVFLEKLGTWDGKYRSVSEQQLLWACLSGAGPPRYQHKFMLTSWTTSQPAQGGGTTNIWGKSYRMFVIGSLFRMACAGFFQL